MKVLTIPFILSKVYLRTTQIDSWWMNMKRICAFMILLLLISGCSDKRTEYKKTNESTIGKDSNASQSTGDKDTNNTFEDELDVENITSIFDTSKIYSYLCPKDELFDFNVVDKGYLVLSIVINKDSITVFRDQSGGVFYSGYFNFIKDNIFSFYGDKHNVQGTPEEGYPEESGDKTIDGYFIVEDEKFYYLPNISSEDEIGDYMSKPYCTFDYYL